VKAAYKADVKRGRFARDNGGPRNGVGDSDAANAEGSGSIRDPHGIRDDRKVLKKAPRRVRGSGRGRSGALGLGGEISAPYLCNANRAALFPTSGITSNGAAQQNQNVVGGNLASSAMQVGQQAARSEAEG
jgi:hypothetical protein